MGESATGEGGVRIIFWRLNKIPIWFSNHCHHSEKVKFKVKASHNSNLIIRSILCHNSLQSVPAVTNTPKCNWNGLSSQGLVFLIAFFVFFNIPKSMKVNRNVLSSFQSKNKTISIWQTEWKPNKKLALLFILRLYNKFPCTDSCDFSGSNLHGSK